MPDVSATEAKNAFDNALRNANNAIGYFERAAVHADPDEALAWQSLAFAVRDLANGLGEIAKGR